MLNMIQKGAATALTSLFMLTGGSVALAQEPSNPMLPDASQTQDMTCASPATTTPTAQPGNTAPSNATDACNQAMIAKETKIFGYGFGAFIILGTALPLGLLLLIDKYGAEGGNALGRRYDPANDDDSKDDNDHPRHTNRTGPHP